jgi:hypothetical protein
MAPAMFQSSEENLGGTLEKKLVWGRTKNWIGRACDLGSAAKKMLCRLRMIDFPENGDRSQRVSRSAPIVAADAMSNNYPQHFHNLTRGKIRPADKGLLRTNPQVSMMSILCN